jgi:hypothetical protein
VGYDLRKQVRIFDEMSQRYERLRLGGSVRAPIIAGALGVAIGIGYALWKRRRRMKDVRNEGDATNRAQNARFEAAIALYRTLETALRVHGLPRPPSRPPLRYAEELQERRHPLAGEVLALTTVYLETRFGGRALTEVVKRDFERRIRDIRAFRV